MANLIRDIISAPPDIRLEATTVAPGAPARNATGAVLPDAVVSGAADRTTLSPLGDLLNTAVRQAASLSTFRADRVAELKGAIAGGSYQPDLGQVAQRVAHALRGVGQ